MILVSILILAVAFAQQLSPVNSTNGTFAQQTSPMNSTNGTNHDINMTISIPQSVIDTLNTVSGIISDIVG